MGLIRHITLFLLLLPTPAFADQPAGQQNGFFERGMLAEFNGNYEEALSIWSRAEEELDIPDARIGFEYIRLATEQGLTGHYRRASELYEWALRAPLTDSNRAAIRQEMDRLRPIAGDGIYRQWREWWRENDSRLNNDMRGFWIQLNPTPGTLYNERLIEHWERIAYARRHYVKNRNTPYHTDDRALTYIRYGEPQRVETGYFTIDNRRIGTWLSRQFEFQQISEAADERDDSFRQLEKYIFRFHMTPEFEIWIYPSLSGRTEDELLFLFGTDIDRGGYYQQSGIDDFIPRRAYLSDRRAAESQPEFIRQGLTPALILQLLYFEQLLDIHPYFEERFTRIRGALIDQGPLANTSLDLSLRNENRERLDIRNTRAPRHRSTVLNRVATIPLQIYQYRLLDEENTPYLLTFIESRPSKALELDLEAMAASLTEDSLAAFTLIGDEIADYFTFLHTFQVYDKSWDVEKQFTQRFPLEPDHILNDFLLISGFRQPQNRQAFQSSSVKMLNSYPTALETPSPFPSGLRGLGSVHTIQPEPLNVNTEELEIADLILGFRDDLPEDYPFPFRVANDQRIPAGQSLVLHFEVYHLEPRPGGFTHFELTYRIYPVTDLGEVLSDQEEFYLTLNFESDQTRVIEDLEIETSSLQNRVYELQVFVQDNETLQTKSRSIRFEVTE